MDLLPVPPNHPASKSGFPPNSSLSSMVLRRPAATVPPTAPGLVKVPSWLGLQGLRVSRKGGNVDVAQGCIGTARVFVGVRNKDYIGVILSHDGTQNLVKPFGV